MTPASFLGSYDFQTWAVTWLPSILMVLLLVLLVWIALRMSPNTKPQKIKPDAAPKIGWAEIAGVDEAKDELQEVVEFLRDPRRFADLGARVPRGILLYGPPGTGKTLLAKAVAHESGATFYAQSASAFVEMFVGRGAARIRRLFAAARKNAPAVVFIDELDAVGGQRGMDVSGERDQTLNQLLVELDGFTGRNDVVVIAASNLLEKLDPALLRPGRFDRQIYVSPPDVDGRKRILEIHTSDKPLDGVDLSLVARQTSGLTGADLANIANEAAIFAARRHGHVVSHADFDGALERVVAGMQSRRRLNEQERRVVAYHEAGHAVCRVLLPSVDPVHKISIVPRGRALGYVMNLPEEDRYLKTREELLDHMVVLLGGRAAEQVVFGSVTTGAQDDLKKVADVAHAMVYEYAMGTTTAPMRLAGEHASESQRELVDAEERSLAEEAFRRALELVLSHRARLDELAETLLAREVLERTDVERIMSGTRRFNRRVGVGPIGLAAAHGEEPRHPAS